MSFALYALRMQGSTHITHDVAPESYTRRIPVVAVASVSRIWAEAGSKSCSSHRTCCARTTLAAHSRRNYSIYLTSIRCTRDPLHIDRIFNFYLSHFNITHLVVCSLLSRRCRRHGSVDMNRNRACSFFRRLGNVAENRLMLFICKWFKVKTSCASARITNTFQLRMVCTIFMYIWSNN